jgi:hypothetical protein
MFDDSALNPFLILLGAVAADLGLLWGRRFNYVVAFLQITFSVTVVGALLLTDSVAVALTIVGIGASTKILLAGLVRGGISVLAKLGEEGTIARDATRLYLLMSWAMFPLYVFLMARGGLGWFQAEDARVEYTADNSIALRGVRHWTPILLLWGVMALRKERGQNAPCQAPRAQKSIVMLLWIQCVCFALLDGSKSAALVLLAEILGAAQLLGFRIPKRVLVPAGVAALALLAYFISLVADEWSSSFSSVLGLRMVSGSQGLLFAIDPPVGKYCSFETVWFPFVNFASKISGHEALSGYTSMGHCLAASDPSYPWELLVPLLAAAYHISPWAALPFAGGFVLFSVVTVWGVRKLCFSLVVPEATFPVCFFVAYECVAILGHGKWSNFVVSDLVSVAAFIGAASVGKRVLASRAAPDARPT